MKGDKIGGGGIHIDDSSDSILVGHRDSIRSLAAVSMYAHVGIVFYVIGEWDSISIGARYFFGRSIAPVDDQAISVNIKTTGFCPGNNGGAYGERAQLLNMDFARAVVGGTGRLGTNYGQGAKQQDVFYKNG